MHNLVSSSHLLEAVRKLLQLLIQGISFLFSNGISKGASLAGNVSMFDGNKIKLNKKTPKQYVIQRLCDMAAADAAAEATAATAVAVATEAAATKGVGQQRERARHSSGTRSTEKSTLHRVLTLCFFFF